MAKAREGLGSERHIQEIICRVPRGDEEFHLKEGHKTCLGGGFRSLYKTSGSFVGEKKRKKDRRLWVGLSKRKYSRCRGERPSRRARLSLDCLLGGSQKEKEEEPPPKRGVLNLLVGKIGEGGSPEREGGRGGFRGVSCSNGSIRRGGEIGDKHYLRSELRT